jgi:hypothetical protein
MVVCGLLRCYVVQECNGFFFILVHTCCVGFSATDAGDRSSYFVINRLVQVSADAADQVRSFESVFKLLKFIAAKMDG